MKFRLQTKILTSFAVIILVILGLNTFVHIQNSQRDHLEALAWWADGVAKSVLPVIEENYSIDRTTVQTVLQTLAPRCMQIYKTNEDKDISHIAIINIAGEFVVHTDENLMGTPIKSPSLRKSFENRIQTTILDDRNYHMLIPIYMGNHEYIGTFDIGVSKRAVDEKGDQIVEQTIKVFGIFMLITFGAISLLVHIVFINPIRHLIEVASTIAGGRLDQTIHIRSSDELGILAQSFVNMRDAVRTKIADLHDEIGRRTQAEEDLRASQQMLRLVLDSIPVRVFWKDRHSVYLGCNQQFAQDLGFTTPTDVIDKSDFDMPWRQDAAVHVFDDCTVMKSGNPRIGYEEIQVFEDNSSCWVHTSKIPLRDQKYAIVGILGVQEDITARKRAEREMNRLRQLLNSIINSMPSILVGVDKNGQVTQWNREAESVTNISSEDAEGRAILDVFPQLASELENLHRAIRKREVYKSERVATQMNNETRYADVVIYPLQTAGIDGAVIRIDDVTERVRIEGMMIQTEKMMTVGGLAAGMAHEINNPLGIILQGIQNMHRRLSPELSQNQKIAQKFGVNLEQIHMYLEQRHIWQYLHGMQEAGQRASKIVTDMLNFSRPSESILTPTDLPQLLETTLQLASSDYDLTKKYDFRHIQISREYDATLPLVPCISNEIEQVILNLLKNAAQSITEKQDPGYQPHIQIAVQKQETYARITIEDNGVGMDETVRKRIFEPFYTTKATNIGTGLGLSVSYFIITTRHKGHISVESEPGKGTIFTVDLPLIKKGGAENE